METGRAYKSGRIYAIEFSPILITAALSVVVLLGVGAWQFDQAMQQKNAPLSYVKSSSLAPESGAAQDTNFDAQQQTADTAAAAGAGAAQSASSSDPISQIGTNVMNQLMSAYVGLRQAGVYSTSTAEAAAIQIQPSLNASISYPTFRPSDIKTDPDTSYARMLAYRGDLKASLAPLMKNTEPEYEIFAEYVNTGDASYLTKLESVAQDYRNAASSTAIVVVPIDAVSYHVAILNAMEDFAATLDAMVAHASDPFASAALLENYDRAESDMLTSFNALTTYEKQKQP